MNKKLRLLVAASLVFFALLSAVWTLLLPDHFADPHDGLLAIADAGGTARIAVLALSLSQLACIIAFAGVAAWLYPTSPKLATIGGTLTVLGGFGHAVFSGAEMARQVMAVDPDVNASVAGQLQSSPPLMPFMMVGLIGTVLGLVLLGIAHLRSGAAPRWTGPVLLAFVVVEFVGSNFTQWATYLSGLLLLGACAGLVVGLLHETRPMPTRGDRVPSNVTVG
ncbi:hypothetical protein CKW39_11200 [Kocuria sp. WRN011]|uniref:hypothetical protein n=1 Tax=Kocuria sp. WRN011 TaxID=2029858 RepID=UPI000BB02C74|nr:hypothetical protein [Kocuria sp. WRN011]PBB07891.1 hypothetical protein CKW39_11200 [Kocuria sp. WRN011]